jgi:hypothetical protein
MRNILGDDGDEATRQTFESEQRTPVTQGPPKEVNDHMAPVGMMATLKRRSTGAKLKVEQTHISIELESASDHHGSLKDSLVFFFASLSCFYLAEALHMSGIISALICGLICNRYAIENLSHQVREWDHLP